MFCTKCGMNNPDGAAFCSGCGAPMVKKPVETTPQPQPQYQQQAQYQQPQQPQYQHQQPQQQPAEPKKKGSGGKIALIVIIVLLIFGLIGGCVYYFLLRDDEGSSSSRSSETASDSVDDDPSDNSNKSDAEIAVDTLKDAVKELQRSGSWSEDCVMKYDMIYDGESMSFKSEIMANVYDYDPDDLDDLRITGSGYLAGGGSEQEWTYTYEDGEATYNYTKPSVSSTTVDMDPSLFNMDTLDEDMIKDVKLKDGSMTFTIDGDAAMKSLDLLSSALGTDSGIEKIEYSDINVKFSYDEDSGIAEKYEMEFSADFTVSGMDMSAVYDIEYTFDALR